MICRAMQPLTGHMLIDRCVPGAARLRANQTRAHFTDCPERPRVRSDSRSRGRIETMAEPSQSEILDFALALSKEAGKLILPLWKNVAVDHKADGSEVTEADRGAEQLLRRLIAERYPDHAILGEEFGGDRMRGAEHQWLVDPIDGTASFAIGLPLFGTLIGYLR